MKTSETLRTMAGNDRYEAQKHQSQIDYHLTQVVNYTAYRDDKLKNAKNLDTAAAALEATGD